MPFTVNELEKFPWVSEIESDVNSIPADSFTATLIPGGVLQVVNKSSKAMGGGLVTLKTAVPVAENIASRPYFGLDGSVYVSPADMAKLGRLELDMKRCIVPGKVGNASTQFNPQTGFWQIDGNPPGWKDTTFKPILPSAWTPFSFRHWMGAETYSVLSTAWGAMIYDVPANMQNVPLEDENWQNVVAIQIQTEILEPGTLTVNFTGLRITFSETAF